MLSKRQITNKVEDDLSSISDLMSALMIIFLFISISYMQSVKAEKDRIEENQRRIKKIAVAYQELQVNLYDELYKEFKDDLPKWKATIEKKTLSVRFEEPDVLFATGSADISDRFQEILRDFFPRYIRIISSENYRKSIEEIRIEGHTSSEWNGNVSEEDAYFSNMSLSQDRTRSALRFCLDLIENLSEREWARKFITANGLSSSHPILASEQIEDKEKSRRVEFRTRTKAEEKVVQLIEEMDGI